MSLTNRVKGLPSLDPTYDLVVVLFNATTHTQRFQKLDWQGMGLRLHPALCEGGHAVVLEARVDDEAGEVTVPARTVACLCGIRNNHGERDQPTCV
ncbi:MAG: alpha-1,6-glucosidase domain-containing protein [Caldilineaceae bacterium]